MSGIPPNDDVAKTKTISSSADPSIGFKIANKTVRSVLMHPIVFPLLLYLNDVNEHNDHPEYIRGAFKHFVCDDPRNMRDNVFEATAMNWEQKETDFTQNLLSRINENDIGKALFVTSSEKRISGKSEVRVGKAETGQVDFIFHNHQSVVALFEFGINNDKWWTKQDQILKYVQMLRLNKDPNYKIDQPMLLSVITINEDTQRVMNGPQTTFAAKFGVFLCIPKKVNEFSVTLLWRHKTNILQDASIQFGKILYAVQLCLYLRESSALDKMTIQYEYLGPNCCRIGKLVRLIGRTVPVFI